MGRGVQDMVLRKSRVVRMERLELSHLSILEPKSSASTNSATSALRDFSILGSGLISTVSGRGARVLDSLDVLLQAVERLVDLQPVGVNRFDGLLQIDHTVAQAYLGAVAIVEAGTDVCHVLSHILHALNAALELKDRFLGLTHAGFQAVDGGQGVLHLRSVACQQLTQGVGGL